jgi:hypothetical protein
MKQSQKLLLVALLSCLPPACTTSSSPAPASPAPEGDVIAAGSTLETYFLPFWDEKTGEKTRLFTFRREKEGYTIIDNATGRTIRHNIYYQKTFGGAFPGVQVHVINSRFIVFPETIRGSEVPDELFCDMKAVTRIYDLKRRRMLPTGASYQYNHNVPLKYDVTLLLQQMKQEQSQ